ncbi:MAG: hypothetical protein FWG25_11080 [Promicromonosporaceae bacterium]|nr:hypothetical protein [Promicromonosporaceae bacterium]
MIPAAAFKYAGASSAILPRLAAERAAVVERNARAIRAMRVSGYADSDIAHLLDISETEVSAVQK